MVHTLAGAGVMEQMELPLERYDIFTDELKPVSGRDFAVYQEAYRAYFKVREAACHTRGYIPLVEEMDRIHREFRERVSL